MVIKSVKSAFSTTRQNYICFEMRRIGIATKKLYLMLKFNNFLSLLDKLTQKIYLCQITVSSWFFRNVNKVRYLLFKNHCGRAHRLPSSNHGRLPKRKMGEARKEEEKGGSKKQKKLLSWFIALRVHSQKPTKKRRKRRRKYYYECQAVAPPYRQLRICRAVVIGKPIKTVHTG